jgi:flagellin-like protein
MRKPEREKPIFPKNNPIRRISDERGVSPVIAVILMVAITVVLSAVLYVMVKGFIVPPDDIDFASLRFEEDEDTPTKYLGEFHGSKELRKVQIKIVDVSNDMVLILTPSEETSKQIPSGLNISYYDMNADNNLDIADILVIYGGGDGDKVTVLNIDTGKLIAQAELN